MENRWYITDFSQWSDSAPPCPNSWKRHCSKWEGRKKGFWVVLLAGIFLFLEIINIDRPSCLSKQPKNLMLSHLKNTRITWSLSTVFCHCRHLLQLRRFDMTDIREHNTRQKKMASWLLIVLIWPKQLHWKSNYFDSHEWSWREFGKSTSLISFDLFKILCCWWSLSNAKSSSF